MVAMAAWMNRLPSIVEIAMIALAAWLVAGWILPPPEMQSGRVTDASERSGNVAPDIRLILDTPLFGEAKKDVAPGEAKPKVVAPSRLTIKLIGTVVADDRSAAVVEMKQGGEQQLFFVGDTMQPGVRLQEVETNAIVVDHGGKLERIEIEEGEGLKNAPPPVFQSPQVSSQMPNHMGISRPMLNQQLGNLPKLMSEARVTPRFTNGKADGFIISNIVPGSLYDKAGLQNGDIIRKVNGTGITGPQQAMEMFQQLQNATSIAVEIERAGVNQVINYDIR